MTVRVCSVYLRQDVLYVCATSKTTVGVRVEYGPIHIVAADADVSTIGNVVLRALSEFRERIPHPDTAEKRRALIKPRHLAAKVKSEREFVRGTRLVHVEECDEGINASPLRKSGGSGSFVGLDENITVHSADSSPESVGRMVLEALELAE